MPSTTFTRLAAAPFYDEGHGFDVFGLHPPYLARAVELGRPIYEKYFRVESRGIEHIPARGPTIVVANHAGILPVDGALLCLDILLRTDPPRMPRAVADLFIARVPIVSTLFARLGVVSGTRSNVRRLLGRGELIVLWPEGVTGPAKPFRARYELQEWRVGFAELALRHGATIVPAAIIGAEESWPLLAKLRLPVLGAPYVPIPMCPVPLPVRYHIRYGQPITFAGGDADDPATVRSAAEAARAAVEHLMRVGLVEREGVFR